MKKRFILGALFGLMAFSSICLCSTDTNVGDHIVYAEEIVEEENDSVGYVTITNCKNGTISVDKTTGVVGELVNITAQHDMFYLIDSVSVNGVSLVESETTKGLFTFALVEGENVITAKFVVDQGLLGELSTIYEQAKNKDWTNLFTLENILRIVSWMLEGGLLIAIVRYFVKDKKVAKQLEETVSEKINEIIPETTKQTVEQTVNAVATPIFNNLQGELIALKEGISILAECYALQQEGTPESKLAIIQALKKVNLGNQTTVENVEKYLKDLEERMKKTYEEVIAKLNSISSQKEEPLELSSNDTNVIF